MTNKLIQRLGQGPTRIDLEEEIERLTDDCEMKDKRIDWTVADNVKKAIEIERLTELLRMAELGLEAVTGAHNEVEARNETLEKVLVEAKNCSSGCRRCDSFERYHTLRKVIADCEVDDASGKQT